MYAVIRDGGRQYRVEEGTVLEVDLRPSNAGDAIEFPEVLLVEGGQGVLTGTPTVPGARVLGEVKGEAKGKKLEILYWRRRKSSIKHTGHRQRYTRVKIVKILTGTEDSHGT